MYITEYYTYNPLYTTSRSKEATGINNSLAQKTPELNNMAAWVSETYNFLKP